MQRDKADLAAALAALGPDALLDAIHIEHTSSNMIKCLWHHDETPSCSVRVGDYGTIVAHCFACGETHDVFDLISAATGSTNFKETLALAAELAQGIEVGSAATTLPAQRSYPPEAAVRALLMSCTDVDKDLSVRTYLDRRGVNPSITRFAGAAFALRRDAQVPDWASGWYATGYRLIVPTYDATGNLANVRACRVIDGDGPKRLTPRGFAIKGAVMANTIGLSVLHTGDWTDPTPPVAVIVEGETDYLSMVQRAGPIPKVAIFGVISGAWTEEIAARLPADTKLVVCTDNDAAGDRYYEEIKRTTTCACVRRTIPRG
jgi:hypothetical protein